MKGQMVRRSYFKRAAVAILTVIMLFLTNTSSFDVKVKADLNTNINSININFLNNCCDVLKENSLKWSEQLYKEFGLKLDICFSPADLYSEYSYGLIQISDISLLHLYMEDNLIQPFNSVLANNRVWAGLPKEIRNAYTDVNGNIWGIPALFDYSVKARYYKKEIMDSLSIPVPRNLDELYDAINIMKRNNIYGLLYPQDIRYTSSAFEDIFNANGCFFSGKYDVSSIGYNPVTQTYEDALNQKEIIVTLIYIRMILEIEGAWLLKDKYVYNHLKDFDKLSAASTLASINSFSDKYYDPYYLSLGITGLSEEKYIHVLNRMNNSVFVLANTNYDANAVNDFINILYDTERGYHIGRYGLDGLDYTINRNSIILHDFDLNSAYYTPYIDIGLKTDKKVQKSLGLPDDYISVRELIFNKFSYPDYAYGYSSPFFSDYSIISKHFNKHEDLGVLTLGKLILSNTDIYEGINEYKKVMISIGAQGILDSLNENLEKTTVFKY